MHQSKSIYTAPETKWTKDQIVDLLERENFKYQRIELPYGLQTGGKDRSTTRDLVLPADLTGKTVLDIGSFSGYFCFEALKRGASRVMGIEYNPERVRQARLLADCLNLPVTFQTANIETVEIKREWDYILCLNVLHHLRNPLAVLEKLQAATREQLILEVASLGRHDLPKLGVSPLLAPLLKRTPLLFVADPQRVRALNAEKLSADSAANAKKKPNPGMQKIYMTPEGARNLLQWQPGVAGVEIVSSPHRDRFIARVQKRRVRRLLIVAGPVAVGKSTLIDRLQKDELPQITERLAWGQASDWTRCDASKVDELKSSSIEYLILHYNLLRPLTKELSGFEDDEPLQILQDADEVFILTMGADASQIRAQYDNDAKRQRATDDPLYHDKQNKRAFFDDESAVNRLYQQWINFIASHKISADIRHEVALISDKFQKIEFISPDDWVTPKLDDTGKNN